MIVQVTPTALQIPADAKFTRTVYAYGDTVYYGTASVSQSSSTGSLTNGQSLDITSPTWFVTSPDIGLRVPGSARLVIIDHDELEDRLTALEDGSAGGLGDSTMGVVVYDDDLAAWPPRPDSATAVLWIGPEAPLVGGMGAVDSVDMWVPTIEDT